MDLLAEEFKKKGNEAYSAKRYADAVLLYTKAIDLDPDGVESKAANPSYYKNLYVYYNNRAAAYHLLAEYDKSAADAEKSLSLNSGAENYKGYVRLATTQWAQKKFQEAEKSFQAAARLCPEADKKKGIEDNLKQLHLILHPPPQNNNNNMYRNTTTAGYHPQTNSFGRPQLIGGEYQTLPTGKKGIIMDLLCIFFGVYYIVAQFFVSAPQLRTNWLLFCLCTIAQQVGVNMYHLNLIPYVCRGYDNANTNFIKEASAHFCSTSGLLFIFALVIGIRPIVFMVLFMTIYSVVDVLHRLPELREVVGAGGYDKVLLPQLLRRFHVVTENNPVAPVEATLLSMHLFAASIECLLTLTIFLVGGSWFTLAFIQYGITRYNKDVFMQIAFAAIRSNIENTLLNRPFVPQFVRKGFEKFCYYLGVVAKMG